MLAAGLSLRQPRPARARPGRHPVAEIPDVETGRPRPAGDHRHAPAGAGAHPARPGLSAGAKVRFGTTFTDLAQDADGVDVTFSDGSAGRYDLVVGADGIRSWTRRALGINLETRATGMGIWRAFGPRPRSVTRTDLYYGGPSLHRRLLPHRRGLALRLRRRGRPGPLHPRSRAAAGRAASSSPQAYHGPWDEIRATLTDPTRVNYTWFETHVLPAPWNRGRVVLIGDAAHSCPPTLAQGAAQALEDAAVLAELLLARDALDQPLWDAFTARRFDRAKTVVDASNQLGQWLLDHVQGDVPGLHAHRRRPRPPARLTPLPPEDST